MTRLQRMFSHVREAVLDRLLDRGFRFDLAVRTATEVAARTVNRHRAQLARGKTVCKGRGKKRRCWKIRGPKLVTRGGSRRGQWWPGKKLRKESWKCLMHRKRFRSKAGLLSHYRSHRSRRRKRA